MVPYLERAVVVWSDGAQVFVEDVIFEFAGFIPAIVILQLGSLDRARIVVDGGEESADDAFCGGLGCGRGGIRDAAVSWQARRQRGGWMRGYGRLSDVSLFCYEDLVGDLLDVAFDQFIHRAPTAHFAHLRVVGVQLQSGFALPGESEDS